MKIFVEILEGLYEQQGEMVGQSCVLTTENILLTTYIDILLVLPVLQRILRLNKFPELDENNYLEENISYRF